MKNKTKRKIFYHTVGVTGTVLIFVAFKDLFYYEALNAMVAVPFAIVWSIYFDTVYRAYRKRKRKK